MPRHLPRARTYIFVRTNLTRIIKKKCKERNLTYRKLAKLSKLNALKISRILNNYNYELNLNDLLRICEGLGDQKLVISIEPVTKFTKYEMADDNVIVRKPK